MTSPEDRVAPLCGDETCTNYSCTQAALDAHFARQEATARSIVRGALGLPDALAQPDEVFTQSDANMLDLLAKVRVTDDIDYSGLFDYSEDSAQGPTEALPLPPDAAREREIIRRMTVPADPAMYAAKPPCADCDHPSSQHEDFREKAARPCLACTCSGYVGGAQEPTEALHPDPCVPCESEALEAEPRCSTCDLPFDAPHCSLNRDTGWSGHTVTGGVGTP